MYYLTPPFDSLAPSQQADKYLAEVKEARDAYSTTSFVHGTAIGMDLGKAELLFAKRDATDSTAASVDVLIRSKGEPSARVATISFFSNRLSKQPLPRVVINADKKTRGLDALLAAMGTRERSVIRSDLINRAETV